MAQRSLAEICAVLVRLLRGVRAYIPLAVRQGLLLGVQVSWSQAGRIKKGTQEKSRITDS